VPESGARNVFFYFLTFLTLYLSAVGLIILTWGLGDIWFPDRLEYSDGGEAARTGIAMVVVAFPAFMFLASYVRRNIASGERSERSLIRKILIYLTLFIVSITAIADVIALIYNFLGGDLTGRFVVRAGGILLVAGLVFLYYVGDLRSKEPSATA
jgi:uncharacterized protein DUF5671